MLQKFTQISFILNECYLDFRYGGGTRVANTSALSNSYSDVSTSYSLRLSSPAEEREFRYVHPTPLGTYNGMRKLKANAVEDDLTNFQLQGAYNIRVVTPRRYISDPT